MVQFVHFLRMYDLSVVLDGCKICTIEDRNFKFSTFFASYVHCSIK